MSDLNTTRRVLACVLCIVVLTSLIPALVGGVAAIEPDARSTASDLRPLSAVSPATTGASATDGSGSLDVTGQLTPTRGVFDGSAMEQSASRASTQRFTVTGLVDDVQDTLQRPVDGPSWFEPVEDGGGDTPLGPTGLLALAGYGRHVDSDPLDNDVRARLYEAVRESPGTFPTALAERLDVHRSTARYHLRVLARTGLVTEHAVDGRRRYVATDSTAAERVLASFDEGTTAAKVIEVLATEGTASVSDVAAAVDRSPGTVTYHLDRLEESGAVVRERDGQAVENRLTAEIRPLVTAASTAGFGEHVADD